MIRAMTDEEVKAWHAELESIALNPAYPPDPNVFAGYSGAYSKYRDWFDLARELHELLLKTGEFKGIGEAQQINYFLAEAIRSRRWATKDKI